MANPQQVTQTIMMIRPAHFGYNAETAENNAFQTEAKAEDAVKISDAARTEFDAMVELLQSNGIHVIVVEDTAEPIKPDAVFPNNWVSFHQDGSVITYPMYAKNRRIERREDIIDQIAKVKEVERRYTMEHYEEDGVFLEGTGSMILDRQYKIVYACLSERTDIQLLDKFCVLKGYEKVAFTAVDAEGMPVYHTNVIMALGETFAVICLECIPSEEEREQITEKLLSTGKEVIDISRDQVEAFAGNMLVVKNDEDERIIVMSNTAYESLDEDQIARISEHTRILHPDIPTIETYGGGSVRCMMAEVF